MEIRTKDQNGTVGRIYGTIAKAASKGKFLDFRNALSLAYLEDYPNIQGIGGAEHAPASGIRLLIQDYSGESKSTSAIIPCWQIDKILEVCRQNSADLQGQLSKTVKTPLPIRPSFRKRRDRDLMRNIAGIRLR